MSKKTRTVKKFAFSKPFFPKVKKEKERIILQFICMDETLLGPLLLNQ